MLATRLNLSTLATAFTLLALTHSGACGGDANADETSSSSSAESAETAETAETGDASDSGAPENCGDGVLDDGEVCDDGNNVTEFPVSGSYAATDCMSDCSMLLADCGNGTVDPGEACDDGNMDSMDECTTSCTVNTQSVHAPCTRSTGNSNTDISSGEIANCEGLVPEPGYGVGCVLSTNIFNVSYVYAAEGDCQMIALKCVEPNPEDCSLAPPDIGDLDAAGDCPAGHVAVLKSVGEDSGIIPDVNSKVCQKACVSDSECRWNASDDYDNQGWLDNGGTPYGQYRCQVTADSNGMKICVDGRNVGL